MVFGLFTHHKFGRRNACLLIFGFVPAMVGTSLFLQPDDRHGQSRVIPVLGHLAPDALWATLWVVLGVTAMICAFFNWRVMRVGYLLAYGLPLIWGAADFISWGAGDLPTGWVAGCVYLGYSLLVVIVSGWDEPGERLELGSEEEVRDA